MLKMDQRKEFKCLSLKYQLEVYSVSEAILLLRQEAPHSSSPNLWNMMNGLVMSKKIIKEQLFLQHKVPPKLTL